LQKMATGRSPFVEGSPRGLRFGGGGLGGWGVGGFVGWWVGWWVGGLVGWWAGGGSKPKNR